ncbi:MAG: hypothetical protein KKA65_06105 [Nanoarchaeota archaeon]|nr:hypothetical protein [Nanoarchaeota archaeon]
MFRYSRVFKVFLIAIVALVFASVGNAFAAANTVPASNAGDGAGAVSGYTISAVHYNLNGTNPQNIDSVTFTTNVTVPVGSTVTIKLVNAGTTWYSCTGQGSTSISCTTTGATVVSADSLRVVIAD